MRFPICAVVFRFGSEWNLLAVGEEWAAARGVSTRKLLLTGFIAGSVLSGPVTAITGPIGFVAWLQGIGVGLAWLVVARALGVWIWHRGSLRYSGAGM